MLTDMVNENFYNFAEQQFISNFNLVQAQAQARAQAHLRALALAQAQAQAKHNEAIDREIYGSDIFRMYGFKIKRCTRMYSHDWTECPYAHRGEKAQRRDPRKYPYTAVLCPAYSDGGCPKGDNCEFAHGLFEFWMHPTKYRTRPCSAGRLCTRRVCFFAHSPDELRSPEPKFNIPNLANKGRMTTRNGAGNNHQQMMVVGSPSSSGVEGSTSRPMQAQSVEPSAPQLEGASSLLESLRTLKMREDEAREMNNNNSFFGGGVDVKESDLPHLDWISELLK